MINLIEDTCRQLGIGALELQVERDNVRAQSLYRKLGFRTHDRIPMSKMLRALGGVEPVRHSRLGNRSAAVDGRLAPDGAPLYLRIGSGLHTRPA